MLSSPRCHQVYLPRKQEILACVLKAQYGDLLDLPEAITAVRSQGLLFQDHKEEAIALLDAWRRPEEISELALTPSSRMDKPKSLEETIKLLQLFKQLHFFLEDYATNAPRPAWISPAEWEHKLPLQLTSTEKRRFLRALCRLQILANIFGLPETDRPFEGPDNDWDRIGSPEATDAFRLFYGTMPPWEYEEMGCVWSYLFSKYDLIAQEISVDLRNLMSNCGCHFFWEIYPDDQRVPFGCEMEIVSNLDHFSQHFDTYIAIGPVFLYRVLHADRLTRRNMIMINTRVGEDITFIGDGLWVDWEERMPFIEPADRYKTPDFEIFWSLLPPIEQPSPAWKRTWIVPHAPETDFEDTVDFYTHSDRDWTWGYALWDGERLEEWKVPSWRVPGLRA